MKKIIIVGGGFAGLNLAKRLSGSKQYKVTLVDPNNYTFFPPLLYQVSTAFIELSNISYPFRRFFQGRENLRFYMGNLIKVMPEANTIETDTGNLLYDYLVLAMGTEANFFGIDNVIKSALPLKTIDDALNLRNHMLLRFEEAARSSSLSDRTKLATIVIAGGGPTGVELAGMLGEMARNKIGLKDYPEAKTSVGSIYLINGGPSLLASMSKKAQREAYNVLSDLGVKILLNTLVKDYAEGNVVLSNGESIASATLVWTSGVIAREVNGLPQEVITKGRRIVVDEINRIKGFGNIFVIGDQCFQTSDTKYPDGHPQLAQVAIQQGRLLAHNLVRLEENKTTKPFVYHDKGSMAIISKYKAVADLPKGSFTGFFAWLIWLFIHLIPLIGFRNKVNLAFSWLWSFSTNDPTLRLIIRPGKR